MSVQPPSSLDDLGSFSSVPATLGLLAKAKRASLPILTSQIFPPDLWHELSEQGVNLYSHSPVLYDWHRAYEALQCEWVRIGLCDDTKIKWIALTKGDSAFLQELTVLSSSAKTVIPCWVIAQAAPNAISHGVLSTRHPSLGTARTMRVTALPGNPHDSLSTENPAELLLNSSDLSISGESKTSAHYKAILTKSGTVQLKPLEVEFAMPQKALITLAGALATFKRTLADHMECHWIQLTQSELAISELRPLIVETPNRATHTRKLQTTVMIATGSPGELELASGIQIEGIGLLRSDHLWSQLNHHPLWLFEKRKKELRSHLLRYLTLANEAHPTERIIYRLHNFTSAELRQMQHGSLYEDIENNPYIGRRGANWYLSNNAFFTFEVSALIEWAKKRHAPTGLLIPFVRDATEWRRIIAHLEKMQVLDHPLFEIWLQLNTPENISQLASYLLPQLKGVIVHVQTVSALARGVDPDDDLLNLEYAFSKDWLEGELKAVSTATESTQRRLLKFVYVDDPHPSLLELVVQLRYDGIVVAPVAVPVVKDHLAQFEVSQLLKDRPLWH